MIRSLWLYVSFNIKLSTVSVLQQTTQVVEKLVPEQKKSQAVKERKLGESSNKKTLTMASLWERRANILPLCVEAKKAKEKK